MSKKLKITESRLVTLGYVKRSEGEKYNMYDLGEDNFNQYGFDCDTIWEFNIQIFKDGGCVMGGHVLIEDFNELRDIFYSALVMNGYREGRNYEKLEAC
jgi:hypothetical protein